MATVLGIEYTRLSELPPEERAADELVEPDEGALEVIVRALDRVRRARSSYRPTGFRIESEVAGFMGLHCAVGAFPAEVEQAALKQGIDFPALLAWYEQVRRLILDQGDMRRGEAHDATEEQKRLAAEARHRAEFESRPRAVTQTLFFWRAWWQTLEDLHDGANGANG
jgi:hypothetical protein